MNAIRSWPAFEYVAAGTALRWVCACTADDIVLAVLLRVISGGSRLFARFGRFSQRFLFSTPQHQAAMEKAAA